MKTPKIADWLLRKVLPTERVNDVLGDLEERYSRRRFPRIWYWWQVVIFCAYLPPETLRAGRSARPRANVLDSSWQDLRFAWRGLIKRPGFTAVVVLTLALGIGANTAIFTAVNSVVLRPLPFPESERLIVLCETHEVFQGHCVASPPNVEIWSERSETLASVGLGRNRPTTLRGEDGSEGVQRGIATPSFLRTFGVKPVLGRLFVSEDQKVGQHQVALLGYEIWQTKFGGDRGIVGKSLNLDGENHEVVGVLPPGTRIPMFKYIKLWTPLPFDPADEANRKWRGFVAVGRLAAGVELEEARNEMNAIAGALGEEYPESNGDWKIRLTPLREHIVGSARSSLFVFLGAVALVLLIGCVNVANLLLARAAERAREIAVTCALGASRWRVVRRLLTESFLLSGVGGVAGLLVGSLALKALPALAPQDIPRLDELSLDGNVLAFAVLVSVLTATLFGLIPALRSSRVGTGHVLGTGPRSSPANDGLRGLLVVSEVALALVLLVGAGLLTRSFDSVLRWEPGFERERLLTLWAYVPLDSYPEGAQVVRFFERAAEEIRAIPSLTAVGATSAGPLFGGRETTQFRIEGQNLRADELPVARWYDVDDAYLSTLGVPLLRGRHFTAADHESAPNVTIINETMARRYWPKENPIGKRMISMDNEITWEVVGIVGDVTPFLPGEAIDPEMYWPKRQYPRWATYFVVRTRSDPAGVVSMVRKRIEALDPEVNVSRGATMDELVARELVSPRFNMLLFGIFAAVALSLAAVGTYGVLSYGVAQRTHELGLRMSLGAERRDILGLVIGGGLKLAALGTLMGCAGAYVSTRWLSHMLHGVAPTDLATFAAVVALILGVAALASYLPARRASRLDPMEALRHE